MISTEAEIAGSEPLTVAVIVIGSSDAATGVTTPFSSTVAISSFEDLNSMVERSVVFLRPVNHSKK